MLDYNIGHDTLALKAVDKNTASSKNNISKESPQENCASTSADASLAAANDSLYENDDFSNRHSQYTNRSTVLCDSKYFSAVQSVTNQIESSTNNVDPKAEYYNFVTDTNEQSKRNEGETPSIFPKPHPSAPHVAEPRSTTRRIPDNLKLTDTVLCSDELSPALSTASGPYISISECISGTSAMLLDSENPSTPLNSLDPRFYDTPRSRINIGLNLTNEPPYSPKRYNYTPVSNHIKLIFSHISLMFCAISVTLEPTEERSLKSV